MLGREGYDGWWCMWCWLYKPEYQKGKCADHKERLSAECTHDGCMHSQQLDIDDIIKQHNDNEQNGRYNVGSSTARRGVSMAPILKKGTIVLAPGLHVMMGIANMLTDYFFDMIDKHVEPVSRAELETRESIPKNELLLDYIILFFSGFS